MPSPEQFELPHTALVWMVKGTDRYGQQTVSSSPEVIKCRWNQRFTNQDTANEDLEALGADVRVLIKIPVGSIMKLGTLSDFLGTGSNDQNQELYHVQSYADISDIKGMFSSREVTLSRYKGVLPTRV